MPVLDRLRLPARHRHRQGALHGRQGVAVGRPYLWGLGAFGQAGVERVLELLRPELLAAMQQVGAPIDQGPRAGRW